MSHRAYEWARRQPVKGLQKSVLLVLGDFANEPDAVTWRGQETIASAVGCDERTVRRHLASLEAAGLIRRRPRYDKRGKRTSDLIVLLIQGAALPDNLTARGPTTGHFDRDYRSEDPGILQLIPQDSSPNPFTARPALLAKLYPNDRRFGLWLEHLQAEGRGEEADVAIRQGWLAVPSNAMNPPSTSDASKLGNA